MWIRSQDKEKLVDLRVFDISKTGCTNLPYKLCGYSDDWANTNNFHIDLGHYSSKEKALKVLDMIHFHLNKGYIESPTNISERYIKVNGTKIINQTKLNVFQMPQNDEVKNE